MPFHATEATFVLRFSPRHLPPLDISATHFIRCPSQYTHT